MRKSEVRALAQAGTALVAVSVIRLALGYAHRPATDLPFEPSVREALIASSEAAAVENAGRVAPIQPDERIDPNSATEVDLDRLPGIGPSLARRIVDARAEGAFRSLTDLGRVPGIGPKKLESLADKLEFSRTPSKATDMRGTNRGLVPRALDLAVMSAEQLQSLDGIGPALAERIVEFRSGHGGAVELDDLLRVPGIGPHTLDRIRRSYRRLVEGG